MVVRELHYTFPKIKEPDLHTQSSSFYYFVSVQKYYPPHISFNFQLFSFPKKE